MPRSRRLFKSHTTYEICFRARRGLPLIAYRFIALLIKSAIARTQRDDKIVLCHDIWNGSHAHLLVVCRDAEQLKRFYEELQKRLTEYIKRLLGIQSLNLWEGRPMVAEVADLQAAKERISYFYANPAQDDLEENIDRFPGYSSWRDFLRCRESIRSETTLKIPWIRLSTIPRLRNSLVDSESDRRLVRLLVKRNDETHLLRRYPNAWMSCFGVNDDCEVVKINKEIIQLTRERENKAYARRQSTGKNIIGIKALTSQPLMKDHVPKKKSRKIFVISSSRSLRIQMIRKYRNFCKQCSSCYQEWRKGNLLIEWPLGAFRPPLPPSVNVLPRLGR